MRDRSASATPMPVSVTVISTSGPSVQARRVTLSPLRGELDGVADHVEQHLLEPQLVGRDVRRRVRGVEAQLDPVLAGPLTHEGEHAVDGVDGREGGDLQLHPAGLDLRQVEHVVEEGEQVPTGIQDVLHVVGLTLVELTEHPLEQHLGEADHRVERGAQLVRHAREEVGLVLAGRGELAALQLELLVQARVGQRDRRLAGEGGEHVAGLVAEGAGGQPPHDERPHDPVGPHERDHHERAPAGVEQQAQVRVELDVGQVGHLHRHPRGRRPADERLVDVDAHRLELLADVVARAVGRAHAEQPALLVVLHERPAVGTGQLDGVLDDGREHLVRVEGRADRLPDLGQGLHLVDLAGQLGRPRLQRRRRARRCAGRAPPAPRRSSAGCGCARRTARRWCATPTRTPTTSSSTIIGRPDDRAVAAEPLELGQVVVGVGEHVVDLLGPAVERPRVR